MRRVRIAWADVPDFMTEILPNPYNGYGTATFPGIPWLVIERVSVMPFLDAPDGDCGPINTFAAGAEVTVEYRPPEMDHGMQGLSRTGPGGLNGSTGGQAGSEQSFVTHTIDYGGEFITYPNNNWRWQYSATGVEDKDPANYKVHGDLSFGVLQPLIEHTISWHQVFWPPWQAVRAAAGKINAYKFANAPRGTLLFLGCSAERELTNTGLRGWSMEYKFTEKNYNTANPDKPRGWNYFLRPNGVRTGQFEPLLRKINRVRKIIAGNEVWLIPKATTGNFINGATVTVQLAGDLEGFPVDSQFRIAVVQEATKKHEIMEVIARVGNVLTVIRGAAGTPRLVFPAGSLVHLWWGYAYDSYDFRKLFTPGMPVI